MDKQDIEANRFAMALLMPREFIEKEWESLKDSEDPIKAMADKFKVSVQAMTVRLIQLKYIKL